GLVAGRKIHHDSVKGAALQITHQLEQTQELVGANGEMRQQCSQILLGQKLAAADYLIQRGSEFFGERLETCAGIELSCENASFSPGGQNLGHLAAQVFLQKVRKRPRTIGRDEKNFFFGSSVRKPNREGRGQRRFSDASLSRKEMQSLTNH